jgi:hypothetical protein
MALGCGAAREGGDHPRPAVGPSRRDGRPVGAEPFPSAVFEQDEGSRTIGHEMDVAFGGARPLRAPPSEYDSNLSQARHNSADL